MIHLTFILESAKTDQAKKLYKKEYSKGPKKMQIRRLVKITRLHKKAKGAEENNRARKDAQKDMRDED